MLEYEILFFCWGRICVVFSKRHFLVYLNLHHYVTFVLHFVCCTHKMNAQLIVHITVN